MHACVAQGRPELCVPHISTWHDFPPYKWALKSYSVVTFSGAELGESRNSQQNKSVWERQESPVSYNSHLLFFCVCVWSHVTPPSVPAVASLSVCDCYSLLCEGKTGPRRGRFSTEECWRSTKTRSLQQRGPWWDLHRNINNRITGIFVRRRSRLCSHKKACETSHLGAASPSWGMTELKATACLNVTRFLEWGDASSL